MIHSEEEYEQGMRRLGCMIEREASMDEAELCVLSELADELITWEENNELPQPLDLTAAPLSEYPGTPAPELVRA